VVGHIAEKQVGIFVLFKEISTLQVTGTSIEPIIDICFCQMSIRIYSKLNNVPLSCPIGDTVDGLKFCALNPTVTMSC
jgi:hypothetical protein